MIGATSFGGGVVAYLRSGLVGKRKWIDDRKFVEYLAISQTLPGLNATNMAVLVGDHLRGFAGAFAAMVAVCLPGGILMLIAGMLYHSHGDNPVVTAMLKGVAAAAVGLILATAVQLGKKSMSPCLRSHLRRPDGVWCRSATPIGPSCVDHGWHSGDSLVSSTETGRR